MDLQEFKNHIEQFDKGHTFKFGISEPFSWRGSYDQVAFQILQQETTREEILSNKAYDGVFRGYKGGEYKYCDYTEVNFEESTRNWTDGGYCCEMIAKIEGGEMYESQEVRLVKLAFN